MIRNSITGMYIEMIYNMFTNNTDEDKYILLMIVSKFHESISLPPGTINIMAYDTNNRIASIIAADKWRPELYNFDVDKIVYVVTAMKLIDLVPKYVKQLIPIRVPPDYVSTSKYHCISRTYNAHGRDLVVME